MFRHTGFNCTKKKKRENRSVATMIQKKNQSFNMCHVLIYHSSNGIFHFNILIFQSGQRSDTQGTEKFFSTVAYINTLIVKRKGESYLDQISWSYSGKQGVLTRILRFLIASIDHFHKRLRTCYSFVLMFIRPTGFALV